jgi:hypothetical protein
LIDLQVGVIVDVEATPAYRIEEVDSTKTMVDRVEERFGLKPTRLVGDTAYGTAPMLAWMVEDKKIAPHVPVFDKTKREDGTLSSRDFTWDERANEYHYPQGHALRSDRRQFKIERDRTTKANTVIYRDSQTDCARCALKQQCCPNTPSRKIARSVHESSREVARRLAETPEFEQSMRDRKKVEMLFAHLKRIMKLDRLRLRGMSGAHDEFLLAATAKNLRKMAKRLGTKNEESALMPTLRGGERPPDFTSCSAQSESTVAASWRSRIRAHTRITFGSQTAKSGSSRYAISPTQIYCSFLQAKKLNYEF